MTYTDFMALLPLLVLTYGAVILMVLTAFNICHKTVLSLTLIILAVSFACIFAALPYAPRTVTSFLRIDAFSLYFIGLVIAASFLITLFCREYLNSHEDRISAFYPLLLFGVIGMGAVASSIHLIAFFLGVEVISLSLYGLIGYTRRHREALEGAMKYLVMAAASSAFMLFGIALIYMEAGTMQITKLSMMMTGGVLSDISLLGTAMLLVVFGFKLALVPFHTWSPDVYQGAPAPVTALIATGSKGAVFAFLLRFMIEGNLGDSHSVYLVLVVLSIATMTVGNILALLQKNVKRLLAYSSIAHLGYLLIPLIAGGMRGASSIAFYFAAYFATTIAAFGVIAVLSSMRMDGDVEESWEYRGLAMRHPVLAGIMTLALISLTGIPPTIGFIAKFYIFSAAIRSGLWFLVIIGVVNSGISAFYYLRLVVAMYTSSDREVVLFPTAKPLAALALGISAGVILFFGIYPAPLLHLTESVMRLAGLGY